METKFNFKSQICTDKIQSKRLLSLGLKKETADMYWVNHLDIWIPIADRPLDDNDLPAWSLHRLIELINQPEHISLWIGVEIANDYDYATDCIEWLIKEGYFPKKYLV